jgi:hypothetical protein
MRILIVASLRKQRVFHGLEDHVNVDGLDCQSIDYTLTLLNQKREVG